jgi:hypothetical protein
MFRLPPSPAGLDPAGPNPAGKGPAGDFSNELAEAGEGIDDRVDILISCLFTRIRHQHARHAPYLAHAADISRLPTPMRPPAAPNSPPPPFSCAAAAASAPPGKRSSKAFTVSAGPSVARKSRMRFLRLVPQLAAQCNIADNLADELVHHLLVIILLRQQDQNILRTARARTRPCGKLPATCCKSTTPALANSGLRRGFSRYARTPPERALLSGPVQSVVCPVGVVPINSM